MRWPQGSRRRGKEVFKTWLQQQKGGLQGRGLFCWPIVLLATVTGGSCCNYHLCHNNTAVVTNTFLSQQNFCHGGKFYWDKNMFVTTNTYLSWQNMSSVATKACLLRQTHVWRNNFCHDKNILLQQIFWRSKHTFVMSNTCLSQQTHVCHDKTFVVAKIIPVAAPANDRLHTRPQEVGWEVGGVGGGGMGNWTEHTYSRKGDSNRQLHASSTKSNRGAVVMKPSILWIRKNNEKNKEPSDFNQKIMLKTKKKLKKLKWLMQ